MPMNAEDQFIQNRVNLPTSKDSAGVSRDIPAQIRARAFFSARVAEAHILERFRRISDDYNTGKIGRDEARALMMEYARASGKDDGTRGLRNLASTARLNLIIDQNASMAHAVGEYERMYSPSALRVFPYVRYEASVGSKKPRESHQKYDGLIFEKSDPWLRTHRPPWDFGCHCQLVQITAKQAGKTPDKIQAPTPADQVKVEAASGFAFDPACAFEENQLPDLSVETKRQMLASIRKCVNSTGAKCVVAPSRNTQTLTTVSGLPAPAVITDFIKQNTPILDDPIAPKTNPGLQNVPQKLAMGTLSPEIVEAFALEPGEDKVFLSRGDSQYGLFHQIRDHRPEMLDGRMLQAIRETLGSARVKYTFCMQKGKNDYLNIESVDGPGYLTLIRKGIDGHWEIVDAHCNASEAYKNRFNRV